MSMSEYFKGLELERKQRKLNNMQKIVPYLKSLYAVKKEEEASILMKAQKEQEMKEWQDKEDYKLNNQLFLKQVDSNNRWNENNLKRQADFDDKIAFETIKHNNEKEIVSIKDQNDKKNLQLKSNDKKADSPKIQQEYNRYKDLYENGQIKQITIPGAKKNEPPKTKQVFVYKGSQYPIDSEIGKEYQKAVMNYESMNKTNNKLDDLVFKLSKDPDNQKAFKELYNLYYFTDSGKSFYQDFVENEENLKADFPGKNRIELANIYKNMLTENGFMIQRKKRG